MSHMSSFTVLKDIRELMCPVSSAFSSRDLRSQAVKQEQTGGIYAPTEPGIQQQLGTHDDSNYVPADSEPFVFTSRTFTPQRYAESLDR